MDLGVAQKRGVKIITKLKKKKLGPREHHCQIYKESL